MKHSHKDETTNGEQGNSLLDYKVCFREYLNSLFDVEGVIIFRTKLIETIDWPIPDLICLFNIKQIESKRNKKLTQLHAIRFK